MSEKIFLGFLGFGSGLIIAGGVVGLMISLSIIPRFAALTRTADQVLLYEDLTLLGTALGNAFQIFRLRIPLGTPFLILFGGFSGIFLGAWIIALSELADIVPIFTRRIRFTQGLPLVIFCLAIGKTLGNLYFYFHGWQ